jgi:hypothetical protein
VGAGAVPGALVRQNLAKAYTAHPNPLVRQVLSQVGNATIVPVRYSLSELIAIENRIAASPVALPGWTGVGVNLGLNRVRVKFSDRESQEHGLSVLESIGVPLDALLPSIAPLVELESTWTMANRPTFGGLGMTISNDTKYPGVWRPDPIYGQRTYYFYMHGFSLGWNVQTTSGVNYFMTASHVANDFNGVNGSIGDTIWQHDRLYAPVGRIVLNPAWNEGGSCPNNPITQTNYDYCTTADVMLGTYNAGITFVRKLGISVTGGVNGAAGSSAINNSYPITGVLSPEYVDDTLRHDGGKVGATTGSTSGEITTQMSDVPVHICQPVRNGCTPSKWLLLQHISEVHAAHGHGDSGGSVYTNIGGGSPYAALGIHVGGQGAGDPCTGNSCYFIFARWDMIEPRLGLGKLNPKTTIP